ncbi:MAG: hypothetical protein H6Q19_2002, partial [Bacteroidetes bacterium]|nr:hypothetical protein [Bacteroidota bacterium]
IVCVSLKASKLLSASGRIVKQGRFLTASLLQFYLRFFSKAERGSDTKIESKSNIMYISLIFYNIYSLELFIPDTNIFFSNNNVNCH